ncbi:endonuclease III [Mesotoga sp.]|uniref:endonuclease III domain-containing protein n=1 Tax=Mesotoga sp. TaxID=2053577 RepID=UPI002633AEBF|nr:endonuclease III [Mesotoga sp.]MDD3680526.1 endonuclease III [Mesotoga sp.]MDD4825175.1 endonuclease III [Mesotoga sp.]MDD5682432.1 endonuclease III [Mesotoga sp.]MDI9367642.1 endonuclease III [Thermotogota bacterium]
MSKSDCSPAAVSEWIVENFPRGRDYEEPFKVLVSTILSQRTRDENTEEASRRLFSVYPDPQSLMKAEPEDLYELIKASGMYRQKAARIINCAKIIMDSFGGSVPDTLEGLVTIPGVGRKTANIVLNVSFGRDALAVDTHVHRIANRLGWVKTKKPDDTEFALMKILPPKIWGPVNGSMVEFGREICRPIGPKCETCGIRECCEFFSQVFVQTTGK